MLNVMIIFFQSSVCAFTDHLQTADDVLVHVRLWWLLNRPSCIHLCNSVVMLTSVPHCIKWPCNDCTVLHCTIQGVEASARLTAPPPTGPSAETACPCNDFVIVTSPFQSDMLVGYTVAQIHGTSQMILSYCHKNVAENVMCHDVCVSELFVSICAVEQGNSGELSYCHLTWLSFGLKNKC